MLENLKDSTERTAYILMDKIQPRPTYNYICRKGDPLTLKMCLSELGGFGAYVRYTEERINLLLSFHHHAKQFSRKRDCPSSDCGATLLISNISLFGRGQKKERGTIKLMLELDINFDEHGC